MVLDQPGPGLACSWTGLVLDQLGPEFAWSWIGLVLVRPGYHCTCGLSFMWWVRRTINVAHLLHATLCLV